MNLGIQIFHSVNSPDQEFTLTLDSSHPESYPLNYPFLSIEIHDQWAKERRRILSSIQIPTNIDDLALVKNRFDGLERDVQKRKPQLELLEQKEHFNKFQICISHPSHFRTQKLL